MRSAFFELNIGSYGLFAAQQGLSVTSNNIANSNTVGYSRQVVTQKAGRALPGVGVGMVGTGVNVTGIERIRNSYLDMKIWNQKPALGEYRIKAEQSSLLEGVFGEPTDVGFTTIFNDLFTGIDNLAKLPDEGERKFALMQSLKGFTQYFQTTSDTLEKYQRDLNFEVKNKVDEINMIARRVESLNRQIYSAEIHSGNIANGLRDERELQIDRLSELVNVEVNEYEVPSPSGKQEQRYSVKINGQVLVEHFESRELDIKVRDTKVNPEDVDGLYDVVWKDGLKFAMNDPNLSGELKGAIDMRDGNANLVVKADRFILANKGSGSPTDPAQITITLDDQARKDFLETGYLIVQGEKVRYTKIEQVSDGKYTFDIHSDDKNTFVQTLNKMEPVVEKIEDVTSSQLNKTTEGVRTIEITLEPGKEISQTGYVFVNEKQVRYTSLKDEGGGVYTLAVHPSDNAIFDDMLEVDPTVQITTKIPAPKLEDLRTMTVTLPVGQTMPGSGYVLINNKKVKYIEAILEDGAYKLTIDSDSHETFDEIREAPGTPQVKIPGDLSGATYGAALEASRVITIEAADGEDIPDTGEILIGGKKVKYTSVTDEKDGKRQVVIDDADSDSTGIFDKAVEKSKPSVQIGEDYSYRGIPYYIHRLNTFVREFAMSMNGAYNEGVDANGDKDHFLFAFKDSTGKEMTDADMKNTLQGLIDDAIAEQTKEKEPFILSDDEKETIKNKVTQEFYEKNMTAKNLQVTKDIRDDVSKICTTKEADKHPGGNDLLLDLVGLKHDRKMFKEGEPNDYMVSIFSELGINAKEAKMYQSSQENMTTAIENQRLSVSQVDQSEEMLSLVKYQQAYQAAARIISTMDMIYDITINRLGAS